MRKFIKLNEMAYNHMQPTEIMVSVDHIYSFKDYSIWVNHERIFVHESMDEIIFLLKQSDEETT
jgi:hypothetical protein